MAEGNEARVAEQQVQAHGEQRQDDDVGRDEGVEARAEERDDEACRENDQRPGNAFHLSGLPSRPQGLTIRIAAISTETAKMEKRGKIRMPNDSTCP